MIRKFRDMATGLGVAGAVLLPMVAWAADEKPKLDTGDTAWMLTSTALVLMMTIPGLALFYGGMVRKKNVLATVMQSFAVTCLVTVLWMVITYSLAFTSGSAVVGGMSRVFLAGMTARLGARPGQDDPRIGLHVLPDDLRHHHPGADRRRLRRTHEVLGNDVVHGPVGHRGLRADRPLGVGRRLPRRLGRARLCRRHRGAHQCRRRGPGLCAGPRQAQGLRCRQHGAAQPRLLGDRCLAAVGRLVRLQRRLGGWRQHQRRHGNGRDPDRHRCGRARLDVRGVDHPRQAFGPRHHLGRGGRSRRHHAGLGLRQSDGWPGDRHRSPA